MNYFVTIKGIEIANNLTKEQAIERANQEAINNNLPGLYIGIGKIKYIKGIKSYTLFPAFMYS